MERDRRGTGAESPDLIHNTAVRAGSAADRRAKRYAQASPFALLPLSVPQYLVASKVLTVDAANAYRDLATESAMEVLSVTNGGQFNIIAPGTRAWDVVEGFTLI